MVALKEGGILVDSLKRKLFDKGLSKTTVLVQFTREERPVEEGGGAADMFEVGQKGGAGDDEDGFEAHEMINIRKFRSVKSFQKRVKRLEEVLQGIESFSDEVRNARIMTPGGDPEVKMVEEVKGD